MTWSCAFLSPGPIAFYLLVGYYASIVKLLAAFVALSFVSLFLIASVLSAL